MRFVSFRNWQQVSKGRLMLAAGVLLWAVMGIGTPALAGPLPSSGTCRMLVVKSGPPPGTNFASTVSMVISVTFGAAPAVDFNIVNLNWNSQNTSSGATVTQASGSLTSVSITTGVNTAGTTLSGFNKLTGTIPSGGTVNANLVPVNGGNTIFVQMTSPEPLNGVCQME